jgi:hypothetical protein
MGLLVLTGMTLVLAQMPDVTSNVGWVNMALQGGSFGVLVLGLAWVAYWLPRWMAEAEKTKQAESLSRRKVAARYRQIVKEVLDADKLNNAEMLKEFANQQRYEREQCASQFQALMEKVEATHQLVRDTHTVGREAVHGIKDVQQSWAAWAAWNKAKEQKARDDAQGNAGGQR